MEFVCPVPIVWAKVYGSLVNAYNNGSEIKDPPPKPLILNGWVFSSDLDKKLRWSETIAWANEHSCEDLLPQLTLEEEYRVEQLSIIVDDPYGTEDENADM
jgi:hypothetical protein